MDRRISLVHSGVDRLLTGSVVGSHDFVLGTFIGIFGNMQQDFAMA